MDKKILSILTLCLLTPMLVSATTSLSEPIGPLPYDPWCDLNDDGLIDIDDVIDVALRFGATGTAINKTELLLELNATVEALEIRMPKKGYISVPAAAFVPWRTGDSEYQTEITNRLCNLEDRPLFMRFVGSVQLPQGVTVTNVTVYWYDNAAEDLEFYLQRYNQSSIETVAHVSTIYCPFGFLTCYPLDGIISYATVDNSRYAYQVEAYVPSSVTHLLYYFQYAVIEYEYPA